MVGIVPAFLEMARTFPEKCAIECDGRESTYAELAHRVRATARELGTAPGPVGVLTDRSEATVVALLGILAAGGVYVPVDPSFPAARRQALLEAAGCTRVLGPSGLVPVPTTAPDTAADGAHRASPAPEAGDPEAPAYTLFTSGSTGRPKPVLTPKRAIAASVASLRDLFALTPADRVLQFASLNWDTCLEEILPALTTGATLVFHEEAYTGSIPRLLRAVAATRVTLLDLPTAFWHELVRHLAESDEQLPDCVRTVVIGGEAVSPARLAEWRTRDTGRVRLVNTYGCTETTLITHAVDLHGPGAPGPGAWWGEHGGVPVGRPLPHVTDAIGPDGELLVSGPALALGYRDLPEVTAERFVTRQGPDGPVRWFRTGDRVARRPDGHLVHEGRLDAEIKVRGIRVDPGEIEAHLTAHPEVGVAVVVGTRVEDRTTVTAYVVPQRADADDAALARQVLRDLRASVPGHLVPHRVTVVPGLVHTAGGKIDRLGTHRRHSPAAAPSAPAEHRGGLTEQDNR
ncbi:amino acid adenylation domain-containing protein [Streptomyces rishiriensis]|uniref:amino acid adenylation domain-containing protein n=1 Tax=Streptomyces rishiriensis TaxID=68264 RepID=UPI000D5946FD|nr:amino acid adenylation domain-containing protein [Streptomyces rishiriensis]